MLIFTCSSGMNGNYGKSLATWLFEVETTNSSDKRIDGESGDGCAAKIQRYPTTRIKEVQLIDLKLRQSV
jgi:hypothetical protein